MNSKTLSSLQSSLVSISKTGEDYEIEGVSIKTEFLCDVNRSTTRSLVFMDGRNVGFIDYVVPFNIFKEPWEYILLEFITENTFEFPGAGWQEDPYPPDEKPLLWSPCFRDMESAVKFFKEFMKNSCAAG